MPTDSHQEPAILLTLVSPGSATPYPTWVHHAAPVVNASD